MERRTKNFLIALALFAGAFFFLGLTSVGYLVYVLAFTEKGGEVAQSFGGMQSNFANARQRAQVARATADIRSLSHGLDMFQLDNNKYPNPTESRLFGDAGTMIEGYPNQANLTTPVSYLSSYPNDPHNTNKNGYRYFSDGDSFYIILSNGPDMDIDIDERLFDGDITPLLSMIYDSSNGMVSSGDIIRTDRSNQLRTPRGMTLPPEPQEVMLEEATSAK